VGVPRPFITGLALCASGKLFFQAKTDGAIVSVQESTNDRFGSARLGSRKDMGSLEQLLTARDLECQSVHD
jgi:hypothetical protein